MTPEQRKKLAQAISASLAKRFNQSYQLIDSVWFLCAAGLPVRKLTQDEIDWHIARKHSPFVEGGITIDHPDWWKEPS